MEYNVHQVVQVDISIYLIKKEHVDKVVVIQWL